MADDGEKFGVWPNTYKHVYEDRWLENFFTEIESNSDWIKTTTFSEYRSKFRPLGNIYLPTASYREMGVWSLPANDALEYERTLEDLQKTEGEKAKQLLRGGFWRSFMVKYPESNHIHKRMFMISREVHAAARKSPKKGRTALMELWKGQCNDAYWHGIFGGLYLPHLRSSLYRHLIRAESLAADILKTGTNVLRDDFDSDGFDDVVVNTKNYTLTATEKGGCISELSLRRQAVNIFDIVSRRPEAYHGKIASAVYSGQGETRTIHDVLTVKEVGLSQHLVYDSYRRTSLIDHFLPVGTTVWDVARSGHKELGDFAGSVYEMHAERKGDAFSVSFLKEGIAGEHGVMIEKKICPDDSGGIKIEYSLTGTYEGLFAVEVNMSLLGSPHALIKRGAKTMTVSSTAAHEDVKNFSIRDKYLDLVINFRFNEGVGLWHYPVETVSLSEDGVERLYQGTCLLFVRNIELQGRKKMWISMSFGQVGR
jgi:alpha-amylase